MWLNICTCTYRLHMLQDALWRDFLKRTVFVITVFYQVAFLPSEGISTDRRNFLIPKVRAVVSLISGT